MTPVFPRLLVVVSTGGMIRPVRRRSHDEPSGLDDAWHSLPNDDAIGGYRSCCDRRRSLSERSP